MSENIIQLNETAIKGELKDLVKNRMEETLNALLEHEADRPFIPECVFSHSQRKSPRGRHDVEGDPFLGE